MQKLCQIEIEAFSGVGPHFKLILHSEQLKRNCSSAAQDKNMCSNLADMPTNYVTPLVGALLMIT